MAGTGGAREGAGRPKGSVNRLPSKAAVLNERLADKVTDRFEELSEELIRIALQGKHDADRLKAIDSLFNRAMGKVPDVVTVEPGSGITDKTAEELLALWKK